jgi:hypothetical protein
MAVENVVENAKKTSAKTSEARKMREGVMQADSAFGIGSGYGAS